MTSPSLDLYRQARFFLAFSCYRRCRTKLSWSGRATVALRRLAELSPILLEGSAHASTPLSRNHPRWSGSPALHPCRECSVSRQPRKQSVPLLHVPVLRLQELHGRAEDVLRGDRSWFPPVQDLSAIVIGSHDQGSRYGRLRRQHFEHEVAPLVVPIRNLQELHSPILLAGRCDQGCPGSAATRNEPR